MNVSSGVGSLALNTDPAFPFRPYYGVTYPASKTALNAFTLALAIELEGAEIKVRAAGPSYTATAINDFQGTDSVEVGVRPLVLAARQQRQSARCQPSGSFHQDRTFIDANLMNGAGRLLTGNFPAAETQFRPFTGQSTIPKTCRSFMFHSSASFWPFPDQSPENRSA